MERGLRDEKEGVGIRILNLASENLKTAKLVG